MSCQQLIQEDPYIFTDTVSNSTSFMHENNSQTKYVPLNRQTIYNRQFRQHEPKLASITDLNNSLLKSSTYSDHHHNNKIVISPTTLKERKNNELNNGKILSSRVSPKFFKSHQQQQQHQVLSSNDGHNVKNNNNKNNNNFTKNHSNASVSINHVSEALENGITGIKKEKEEEMSMTVVEHQQQPQTISNNNNVVVKIENENELKIEQKECYDDNDDDSSENEKLSVKKINSSSKRTNRKRDRKFCLTTNSSSSSSSTRGLLNSINVIVEPICEIPRHAPLVQHKLNVIDKRLLQNYRHCSNESKRLSRDERLSMRKMQLRHVLNQYKGINRLRDGSTERYKAQLSKSFKLSKVMEREKQRILKKSIKLCSTKGCKDEAVVSTDFCTKHIFSTEKEQFLIRQCCFRHLDGQQCRVPVSNILATIAVCNDHMNAPAHQLISSDSNEPKKNPVQRKRTKTSPLIRPVKKNGKQGRKKKLSSIAQSSNLIMPVHRPTMIIHPSDIQKQTTVKSSNGHLLTSTAAPTTTLLPLKQENLHHQNDCDQFIHFNSGNLLASSQSSYGSMSSGNEDLYIKQDLMPAVCENSYESSEDTGVGGLSENELISHDVIGNFDMESCAELSKVLSSLPSNTLDDLLTEPLHTSRDDEEYLDRAIEEVSASGMDQIAITAFEHLEGLDMLEMLDDDEQRQMISAATNLISMSGYMSHDQDNNYAAMPSPMMS